MKFLIKNLSFLLTAIFRRIYSFLISKIFSFGLENQIRHNNETQKNKASFQTAMSWGSSIMSSVWSISFFSEIDSIV
jgi:hypothetical protein